MHEVSLMEQAMDLALRAAKAEGAVKILGIRLRIGALAGVVPEAMEFAYEAVAHGTIAEGGKFEWEEVPVACRCAQCGAEFEPDGFIYVCPTCSVISTEVVRGRELDVVDVEIELPDE